MELKEVMQLLVYWHVFVVCISGLYAALDARYTIKYRADNNLQPTGVPWLENSPVYLSVFMVILSMLCCFFGYWYMAFTVGPIKSILPMKTSVLEEYIRSTSK